jgi:hypothetical protein
VFRLARAVLLAVLALAALAPSASAVPDKKLGGTLGAMWKTVLETPKPQNPFFGGSPCIDLGGTVAPFSASGANITCTVKPGTKIFVAAYSSECSTFEGPPYDGTDDPTLRACAHRVNENVETPFVTLDGKPVSVAVVESPLLHIVLPANNIFDLPARTTGLSVAHGWVALLHPLTPGKHVISLHIGGTDVFGNPIPDNTTTIIVKPGR